MSAGFRISPALWDKIHHFASFPQTGGKLAFYFHLPCTHFMTRSIAAADGPLRTESEPGDLVESEPIPRRCVAALDWPLARMTHE
jgi:hypothetical protein